MTDWARFKDFWCIPVEGGCSYEEIYGSLGRDVAFAAWQASRKQALGEAALECEANARYWNCQAEGGGTMLDDGKSLGGTLCAEDIRSLANPEGEQG